MIKVPNNRIVTILMTFVLWSSIVCGATNAQEFSPADRNMLQRAERVADRFVKRFRQTLDFGVVWKEFHSSNPVCAYRSNGFFSKNELEELKPPIASLEKLYLAVSNYYYLKGAYLLTVARMYPDSKLSEDDFLPRKVLLAERRVFPDDNDSVDPSSLKEIDALAAQFDELSRLYRKYMPRNVMRTGVWRANIKWLVNRGGGIVHLGISNGHEDCVPSQNKVYIVDRGLFYFYFVDEDGEMRVVELGMIDSV